MAKGVPVQAEMRARIIQLAREGKGRNEIAAEVGYATTTVTRICEAEGVSFDRSATAVAVKARSRVLAERRQALTDKLLGVAESLAEQLSQPYTVHAFAGKDGDYKEHELPRPPAGEMRNLMTAVGIAVQRAVELENVGAADSVDEARSMLGAVGERLGVSDAA